MAAPEATAEGEGDRRTGSYRQGPAGVDVRALRAGTQSEPS